MFMIVDVLGFGLIVFYYLIWLFSLAVYSGQFDSDGLKESWFYLISTSMVIFPAYLLHRILNWEVAQFRALVFLTTLHFALAYPAIWLNIYYLLRKDGFGVVFYPIHGNKDTLSEEKMDLDRQEKLHYSLIFLAVLLIVIPILMWLTLMGRLALLVY